MESDTYKTISSTAEGLYKEKGSRFISMAFPVTSIEEIKPVLERLRKEHHSARHHCYAWILGADKLNFRSNDDGEPSGTAGKPILGQINSAGLTDLLIVVIRYFGGTLLGVSGLIQAYKSAAADAIRNSEIVEKYVQEHYVITFPYSSLNDVMKILKEENAGQSEQSFGTECRMKISIRASFDNRVLNRLSRVEGFIFQAV